MDLIDFEDLKGDVAPADPANASIAWCCGLLFQNDQGLTCAECGPSRSGFFRETEDFGIEVPMCVEIANRNANPDLRNPLMARRHQANAIAVRIDQA